MPEIDTTAKKENFQNSPRSRFSLHRPPVNRRKKKDSFFYHIGLLVIFSFILLSLYGVTFALVLKKKDSIIEAMSKLSVEQLKEEELRFLRESFRATEAERAALDAYFIDTQEVVAFIEEIEAAGRRAGAITSFNYVNIRGAENTLVMEFEAFGSFTELFYFTRLVEFLPAKISIEKFLLDKEIPRTFVKRKESDTWHAVVALALVSFENK